jgi:hypothetical protein
VTDTAAPVIPTGVEEKKSKGSRKKKASEPATQAPDAKAAIEEAVPPAPSGRARRRAVAPEPETGRGVSVQELASEDPGPGFWSAAVQWWNTQDGPANFPMLNLGPGTSRVPLQMAVVSRDRPFRHVFYSIVKEYLAELRAGMG